MHTRVPLNACHFLVLRIAVNSNNLILEKENYVAHLTASKNILLQMNEHALKKSSDIQSPRFQCTTIDCIKSFENQ